MTPDDLIKHAARWDVALRAAGQAPNTVRTYCAAARMLAAWQRKHKRSGFDKDEVRAFLAHIQEPDRESAKNTANSRGRSLRRFSAWLAADLGIPDALDGMETPARGKTVVKGLADDEISRLIAACDATYRTSDRKRRGRAGGMVALRDEAIVLLAADSTARAEELLAMDLPDDLDLDSRRGKLRRTKNREERTVAFDDPAAQAIALYLEARRKQGFPADGPLWITVSGTRLSYSGLYDALKRRAAAAGINGVHPHRLRHTSARRWFEHGGSTTGLLQVGGWSSEAVMRGYIQDHAEQLALAEFDRIRRPALCLLA